MGEESEQGGDGEENSPFRRIKNRFDNKLDSFKTDVAKEFREELEEHDKHLKNAHEVALDLVDPETLDKLVEIIREKPEVEEGFDKCLWWHIFRKTFSNIIFKTIDIGTDLAAAAEHFERRDYKYAALTLFFVYLPGFVLSCGFTIWGLFYKREGDPPVRKKISLERIVKYIGLLFLFPFLYPIIQILLGVLFVGLLIRRRDHVARHFMGHDLKQFKSLEGFLESGPSFCLQTYILLVGHKKGTNIDWDNVKEDDIERLLLLSCSILFSFISLVKTSCSVNVPDPDPRRTQPQYKKSAKYFVITLVLFNLTCILYRIIGISFFCVYLRQYIILIIVTGFLCNLCTWLYMSRSPTISIILGAISIFVPNGYLLYNFAGTLVVDLSRRGSKVVFFVNTIGPNIIWAGGIVGVAIYTGTSGLTLKHIISDHDTHLKFLIGMNIVLGILGLLSTMLGIVHWYCSIEKLFVPPPEGEEEEEEEEEKEEDENIIDEL